MGCFGSKKKKRNQEEKNILPSPWPDHSGGPGNGVWPIQPLPPYPNARDQNLARETDDGKGSNHRKNSAFDLKSTAEVNQSLNLNSDLPDSPITRKTSEFKQPLPSTPDKSRMSSTDSVENGQHKLRNSYEEEQNMTQYPNGAYEEQHTRPRRISSDENKDKKSAGSNHEVHSKQQTTDPDSEPGQRSAGNWR